MKKKKQSNERVPGLFREEGKMLTRNFQVVGSRFSTAERSHVAALPRVT